MGVGDRTAGEVDEGRTKRRLEGGRKSVREVDEGRTKRGCMEGGRKNSGRSLGRRDYAGVAWRVEKEQREKLRKEGRTKRMVHGGWKKEQREKLREGRAKRVLH